MKRNAIVRIILYTILALVLTGVLIAGIEDEFYLYQTSIGSAVEESVEYDPTMVNKLEINWASGKVILIPYDTEQIILRQSKPEESTEKMYCALDGGTLKIDYSKRPFHIGTLPEKELLILVPSDWVCEELEIDGASLQIEIRDQNIGKIDLDGASCSLNFSGSVENVEVDGASADIHLVCSNRISSISVDGASCKLDVTLPAGCGFRVDMDGLGCKFNSDLAGIAQNGHYSYGDQQCKIEVDGLSCEVRISAAE